MDHMVANQVISMFSLRLYVSSAQLWMLISLVSRGFFSCLLALSMGSCKIQARVRKFIRRVPAISSSKTDPRYSL